MIKNSLIVVCFSIISLAVQAQNQPYLKPDPLWEMRQRQNMQDFQNAMEAIRSTNESLEQSYEFQSRCEDEDSTKTAFDNQLVLHKRGKCDGSWDVEVVNHATDSAYRCDFNGRALIVHGGQEKWVHIDDEWLRYNCTVWSEKLKRTGEGNDWFYISTGVVEGRAHIQLSNKLSEAELRCYLLDIHSNTLGQGILVPAGGVSNTIDIEPEYDRWHTTSCDKWNTQGEKYSQYKDFNIEHKLLKGEDYLRIVNRGGNDISCDFYAPKIDLKKAFGSKSFRPRIASLYALPKAESQWTAAKGLNNDTKVECKNLSLERKVSINSKKVEAYSSIRNGDKYLKISNGSTSTAVCTVKGGEQIVGTKIPVPAGFETEWLKMDSPRFQELSVLCGNPQSAAAKPFVGKNRMTPDKLPMEWKNEGGIYSVRFTQQVPGAMCMIFKNISVIAHQNIAIDNEGISDWLALDDKPNRYQYLCKKSL